MDQLPLPAEMLTGWQRPARVDARAEIARLTAAGYGPVTIARALNERGVSTPSGRGQWHHATVIRHVDPGPWRDYVRAYRATRR